VKLHRAAVFRLYPTKEQAARLTQFVGAARYVYNLCLEQRETWGQRHKLNSVTQCREVTQLRAETQWLGEAPAAALQQAVLDLDKAFSAFFAKRAGYPQYRRKGQNDSYRMGHPDGIHVRRHGRSSGAIKLPKIGWVRLRGWRELPGDLRSITVTLRAGVWSVSVLCQRETVIAPSLLPAVGIDLGVAVFAAMSTGEHIAPANHGKRALVVLKRAQRAVARKKKGSANRRKAVAKVSRLHARVRNARKDFLHKASKTIAQNHGTVVVEDLRIRAMTASASGTVEQPGRNVRQKAGLNRSILDQGWGEFRQMLDYKLAERGGRLVTVPAAYSSQTCAECGVIDADSRRDQATFVCRACGHAGNADTNAARNLLRRLDEPLQPVEGHRASGPMKQEDLEGAAQ
jgi:putative transposase